ncbi:LOW QUALITY PROTEIN: LAMA5-like protein [Mya arenaria]|uniref:LAMA5-like protein n=1 Tax=Mya arenaria TaxID=6604 RepID=A0ABY7F4A8_MYAAR|nr:LOW QUALITY PROTEIN: LAMA5-like protein [Mya arenaria]
MEQTALCNVAQVVREKSATHGTGNATAEIIFMCDSCINGIYGDNCVLQCSQSCEENICNIRDGTCNCRSNYSGEQCENCIRDRYGEGCTKPCSLGCLENSCSSTDGKCDCKYFYKGGKCDVCEDGRLSQREAQGHTDEQETTHPEMSYASKGQEVKNNTTKKYIHLSRLCTLQCRKKGHTLVPGQQRESRYGNRNQQPHTSYTENNAETGNKLYEDIASDTDDLTTVQENFKKETGHSVTKITQHVELVIIAETLEDGGLEIDEDDQKARGIATKFKEKGGIY